MRHTSLDPTEKLLSEIIHGNVSEQITAREKILSLLMSRKEISRFKGIGIEIVCFVEPEKNDRKISFLFRFEGREVGVFALAKARVLWTSENANRVPFHFLDDIHSKLFQTIEASFDTSGLYGHQQG